MSAGDDVVASLVYGGFAVTFMSILLFAFVRYCKVRALYSPMDYAMGFSISGCGLNLIWAASTISAPVVPILIAILGLSLLAGGLVFLKGRLIWRHK
jgi:hypothetical protein